MSPKTKALGRVNEEAIQLPTKELGAADTAGLFRQFTTGTGDYTEERRERFAVPSNVFPPGSGEFDRYSETRPK